MDNEERLTMMYQGYTEAFIWAEIPLRESEDDDDDRTFEDRGYCVDDFNAEAVIDIRTDILRLDTLVSRHGIVLPDYDHVWQQLGSDLYFERQGHGVGFRDRRDIYGFAVELLDALVEKNFSETYAWIDGRGRIAVETYTPREAELCV